MIKDFFHAYSGYRVWLQLKRKYHIDEQCVVAVLPEHNQEWNECAIRYLPDYMKRKRANKAMILYSKDEEEPNVNGVDQIVPLSKKKMRLLMKLYCLKKFSDNIVFFYLDYPRDNLCSLVLDKGDISMDELICLGLYRLREVPQHV